MAAECAVVSASHNPAEYNGVKLFAPGGRKLTTGEEEEIEALLGDGETGEEESVSAAEGLGERYVGSSASASARRSTDSGSRSTAPTARCSRSRPPRSGGLARARSSATGPTGRTSTRAAGPPTFLSRVVREENVDFGVAFDGDGDRVLAVDASGAELDGDSILAVLALHLGVEPVAVTRMTNLGFQRLLRERGIRVVTTDVGDRHVLEGGPP